MRDITRSISQSRKRVNGAKGERARKRIEEIDARKQEEAAAAGRRVAASRRPALHDGGSLTSDHTTARLAGLCDKAFVCALDEDRSGKRRFVLQHADEPSARLAQIWLLPPYEPGRYDKGAVRAGLGPTLLGAQTHAALPMVAAAPLVSHVLDSIRQYGSAEAGEAAAALPGLSAWIASLYAHGTLLKACNLDSSCGIEAADAALLMAMDGSKICDFPQGIKMRTVARPVWEALASQYAEESEAAEEVALYRDAGASHAGIAYVADTSPEALLQSGGAMSLLAWPATDYRLLV